MKDAIDAAYDVSEKSYWEAIKQVSDFEMKIDRLVRWMTYLSLALFGGVISLAERERNILGDGFFIASVAAFGLIIMLWFLVRRVTDIPLPNPRIIREELLGYGDAEFRTNMMEVMGEAYENVKSDLASRTKLAWAMQALFALEVGTLIFLAYRYY
jgi:hypothetical protein